METRSNHILVGGVVLALLAALVAFIIWLAGLGGGRTKEYDIFFTQSVEGLSKGSSVSYSGVPSGSVRLIALWKDNPGFVRVRIAINEDVPVLEGTTAAIQGVGFTGVSQIQLEGATKGAPPISEIGPAGVPTIPTRQGGLGALLNNAPQLVERLSTLTERLTEILSDENQKYFSGILSNVDRASGALAERGPDLKLVMDDTRRTIRQAEQSVASFGALAEKGTATVEQDVRPLIADLRNTIVATQTSMKALDSAIADARPGIKSLSNETLPEVNLLVRDLRTMSETLGSVATKIDQQGAGALIGGGKLPDYEPGKVKQ
jgi:phospholipid/cholesterol/gamma-HCH transport system substrate-binding protein